MGMTKRYMEEVEERVAELMVVASGRELGYKEALGIVEGEMLDVGYDFTRLDVNKLLRRHVWSPGEPDGVDRDDETLAEKGENAAERYLRSRDYEILERDWSCRFGEVEFIAHDPNDTLCFIKVRTRRFTDEGMPEECDCEGKRDRLEKLALCYLMVTDDWDDNESVRFDSIAICVTGPGRAMLRHHRGAFNLLDGDAEYENPTSI